MSVFTTVTIQQLSAWLQDYTIGEVVDLKGISAGITNTNYFVITQQHRYVLTLFEQNTLEELPYFIDLMSHLAHHGVPCPEPVTNQRGESLHMLNGKPAVLMTCLKGQDLKVPAPEHCAEVGRVLAQMHLAGQSFVQNASATPHRNPRDAHWRRTTAAKVMAHLNADDQALLTQAMEFQDDLDTSSLPQGVIHADLFRDNVLFDGDQIGGLIDFYYAYHDALIYDLAITANDWCILEDGRLDQKKLDAFQAAYEALRPLADEERCMWNSMLRIAALRFWLSRLHDKFYPQDGDLTHAKDPDHFRNILKLRWQGQ